ncbi:hypothetical protein GCM10020295_82000 [Streptomyces cinereospinus]
MKYCCACRLGPVEAELAKDLALELEQSGPGLMVPWVVRKRRPAGGARQAGRNVLGR